MTTARPPRVLVTGSTGFIGARLVDRLAMQGLHVTRLQRRPSASAGAPDCRIAADFQDATLASALADLQYEVVFHLAGYGVRPGDRDPGLMQALNVDAGEQLLRHAAAHGARVFIFAGTGSEYDFTHVTAPVAEAHPTVLRATADQASLSAYGASKAEGGRRVRNAAAALGVSTVHARLFNVYGPGEAPHRLLPSLHARLARGETVDLSEGTQLRDFLHVDDACDALIALMTAARAKPQVSVVNVASGEPRTVREFCRAVAASMKAPPDRLRFGALPLRTGETPYFVGDPAKLHHLTTWRPRYTFESGINAAVSTLGGSWS